MLTIDEIRAELARVSYKPNFSFEAYVGRWEFNHLVIRFEVEDAFNPGQSFTAQVESMLPPIPDSAYFQQWLLWRLARIEVHECREFFRIDNEVLDNPHAEFADRDL